MARAIPPSYGDDDFEPWELRLVSFRVDDFLRTRPPHLFDADDLFQEALLHWWMRRDRFNPGREASRETFLRRIVDAKLRDIERERTAQKRGGRDVPLSLDSPIAHDSDTILNETIAVSEGSQDLRQDLLAAAAKLTPRQRRLLSEKAAGRSVSEIAGLLDVSRDTLHEDLKRIRQTFTDAGLLDYLA